MATQNSAEYDIAIAGAGMVGSTLARLLADLPLKIALVDRQALQGDAGISSSDDFDLRVSALTPYSRQLLTRVGAWSGQAIHRYCDYIDMHVWDADGTGAVHFSAAELNEAALGTIVENRLLLHSLHKLLLDQDNLQLHTPIAIESLAHTDKDHVEISCSGGEVLRSKLLIAADGGNSRVRELADFPMREWDYNHVAMVTTVQTERPHCRTAWQRFMATGPLAFLPLSPDQSMSEQHHSSIVWSATPDRNAELEAMDDEAFRRELGRSIEHRLGEIEVTDRRVSFPLRQRHAREYVRDGIVLVGDAAHTIHPLAGQGVNLGFLDAEALANELVQALRAGREIADPVPLQRYQRSRIGHNLGMMALMEGFKHLFAEEALPVRWLRNVGMSGVDSLPAIKNALARRAMNLQL